MPITINSNPIAQFSSTDMDRAKDVVDQLNAEFGDQSDISMRLRYANATDRVRFNEKMVLQALDQFNELHEIGQMPSQTSDLVKLNDDGTRTAFPYVVFLNDQAALTDHLRLANAIKADAPQFEYELVQMPEDNNGSLVSILGTQKRDWVKHFAGLGSLTDSPYYGSEVSTITGQPSGLGLFVLVSDFKASVGKRNTMQGDTIPTIRINASVRYDAERNLEAITSNAS